MHNIVCYRAVLCVARNILPTLCCVRIKSYLVPMPHCSARPKHFRSSGPGEDVRPLPARSPRIRHRSELTERDWENAEQGLGKIKSTFLISFYHWLKSQFVFVKLRLLLEFRTRGVLSIMAYTVRLRPKGVLFSGFRYNYKRIRISSVEVYERVGKSVIPLFKRSKRG